MSYYDNDRLKQFFFIVLILLIGGVLFWKLTVFIPAFLGALTLYVIMRPVVVYLVYKKKWKKGLTAILLILLSLIVILGPIASIAKLMSNKISFAVNHSGQIIDAVRHFINQIKASTNIDLLSDQTVQKVQDALSQLLPQLLGSTFSIITTLVIMYFILYFMLTESINMEDALCEYLPLKDENTDRLGHEVKAMGISNAVGSPLLALVQGGFCILGYWIFGVDSFVFWGIITGMMGVVPVVGTAVVWVPMVVYVLVSGNIGMGVGLGIYCLVVVGSVDNIFRFIWQKKFADVHPLITIFGVLIGVSLFGFLGLIFGPLLLSMFILLLKIYRDEFNLKKKRVKIYKNTKKTVPEKRKNQDK